MAKSSGERSLGSSLLRLISGRAAQPAIVAMKLPEDAVPTIPENGSDVPKFHSPANIHGTGELPSGEPPGSSSLPNLKSGNSVSSEAPPALLPGNTGNLDLAAILEAASKITREPPAGAAQIEAARKFTEAANAVITAYGRERSVGIVSTRHEAPSPVLSPNPAPKQNVQELENNAVRPSVELPTTNHRHRRELPAGDVEAPRSELEAGHGNFPTALANASRQQVSELPASSGRFPEPPKIHKLGSDVHELDASSVSSPSPGSSVRGASTPLAQRPGDRERDARSA